MSVSQPIYFLDFEGNHQSGILEYGVVAVEEGRVQEVRTRLCRAKGPVRPEDARIHRLRDSDTQAFAPFSDDWEFFAGCRERGLLAAHFAQVERSLLKSVWPYPRSSPNFLEPDRPMADWGPWVDTGRLAGRLFPTLPSARLEELVGAFGVEGALREASERHCPPGRRTFHCALYDALAGALVLLAILSRDEFKGATLGWLLENSLGDAEKREDFRQGSLF